MLINCLLLHKLSLIEGIACLTCYNLISLQESDQLLQFSDHISWTKGQGFKLLSTTLQHPIEQTA